MALVATETLHTQSAAWGDEELLELCLQSWFGHGTSACQKFSPDLVSGQCLIRALSCARTRSSALLFQNLIP